MGSSSSCRSTQRFPEHSTLDAHCWNRNEMTHSVLGKVESREQPVVHRIITFFLAYRQNIAIASLLAVNSAASNYSPLWFCSLERTHFLHILSGPSLYLILQVLLCGECFLGATQLCMAAFCLCSLHGLELLQEQKKYNVCRLDLNLQNFWHKIH